jgi:hypothetical protein
MVTSSRIFTMLGECFSRDRNKENTMSTTKSEDNRKKKGKRTNVGKQPATARSKKDKRAARLFVSFWHVCLENLPEGTFTHRRITPGDAKLLVEAARREGSLLCVSGDDLLAPYRKKERSNQDALRRVLAKHFGIVLAFRDFTSDYEAAGNSCYSTIPLNCISVTGRDRLLVVTCCYTLNKKSTRKPLGFKIAPTTVEFHQFESTRSARHMTAR